MAAVLVSILLDMDGAPLFLSPEHRIFQNVGFYAGPVAPTHKTPVQRPKPRAADETNGLFMGLGAPLGHRRNRLCAVVSLFLGLRTRGNSFNCSLTAHNNDYALVKMGECHRQNGPCHMTHWGCHMTCHTYLRTSHSMSPVSLRTVTSSSKGPSSSVASHVNE